MNLLLKELRHNPLLWLLVFVPALFVGESMAPDAHTLLFVLSVLAIVPLAALLSHVRIRSFVCPHTRLGRARPDHRSRSARPAVQRHL